mmetsp:Transcript_5805/g.10423  ORF Transcript_5805/g.10423 Transcript_5805/m.10423 type:complete len:212 (+) Transcript_5805:76-711(+)
MLHKLRHVPVENSQESVHAAEDVALEPVGSAIQKEGQHNQDAKRDDCRVQDAKVQIQRFVHLPCHNHGERNHEQRNLRGRTNCDSNRQSRSILHRKADGTCVFACVASDWQEDDSNETLWKPVGADHLLYHVDKILRIDGHCKCGDRHQSSGAPSRQAWTCIVLIIVIIVFALVEPRAQGLFLPAERLLMRQQLKHKISNIGGQNDHSSNP